MVPDGWRLSTIGDHVDLLNGHAFKSSRYSDSPDDIRLLRGDNVGQGFLRWRDAKRWSKHEYNQLERYQLKSGDFVIAMDRTWIPAGVKISEVQENDLPCLLLQRVARLRTKQSLKQGLLKHFFSSHRFEQYVKKNQTETAVPHISSKDIQEFPILLPPLSEQRRIAEILSTWDKAIEATEKLIANSEAQKRALMQQLLKGRKRLPGFHKDWKQKTLGSLATIKKGTQKSKATLQDEGLYPVINGGISPSGYTHESNTAAGTITISEGGNSCGYVGLIEADFWSGGHCYTLNDLKVDRDFLFPVLKWLEPKIMRLRVGSGLPNIQKGAISQLEIPFPEQAEQEAIADIMNAQHAVESVLQRDLERQKREKSAMMQQLLTGKRRVKIKEIAV